MDAVSPTTTKYDYVDAKTPMITDISPEYGDAESPPDVVLTGSNFGTTKADLTIVLSGYVVPEAKITSISDTSITISGMKKKSELITDGVYTHGTLSFFKKDCGSAINSSGKTYTWASYWSKRSTWDGEIPPRDGESVHIPKGQSMILDESTNKLNLVNIEGELRFADDVATGLKFEAKYVFVKGGKLIIGTAEKPIEHKVEVVIRGAKTDAEIPIYGNKVIAVRGGELSIHGKPQAKTWTKLNSTVNKEENALNTATDFSGGGLWDIPHAKVAVASSTFDWSQAEQLTVSSLSGHDILTVE